MFISIFTYEISKNNHRNYLPLVVVAREEAKSELQRMFLTIKLIDFSFSLLSHMKRSSSK